MSEPFAYLNAINTTKVDLMTGSEDDEQEEKEYVPFVVNRSLSYFPDTVLYANEMNLLPDLDKKLQFHYLICSVRARKRYSKWVKRSISSDIETIKAYYKCNTRIAETYSRILTECQIETLRSRLNTGGQQ